MLHTLPLLLLSYTLMAIAMTFQFGTYSWFTFTVMSLAYIGVLYAAWRATRHPDIRSTIPERSMALVLMLFLASGLFIAPAIHLQDLGFLDLSLKAHAFVLLLVGIAYVGSPRYIPSWLRTSVFIIALCIGAWLHFQLIPASPAPRIDVFVSEQESAQYLLEGKNPYSTPVSNPYEGQTPFGYEMPAYTYLPLNLLLQTASFAVSGDVRYAHCIAILLITLMLWYFCRGWGESASYLLPLLFLYHPVSLFVLEQGWTEPLVLCGFAISILAMERGKRVAGSIAAGLAFSLKQYLFFLPLHWFFAWRSWKLVLLALIAAAVPMIPFLLWDAESFIQNGVLFQLATPFRDDALALSSVIYELFGITPGTIWNLIVGLGACGGAFLWFRRRPSIAGYLFAVIITAFSLFFLGSRGLTNYYYLLSGLMLFLFVALLRPDTSELRVDAEVR